ncbi:MAG: aminomethyltransferase [Lentimonas sp.]|jgi:aminomethyltransferase
MTAISQIPLHAFHAEQGARFVNFGGWNMPVQYAGILEEHRAVREAAGLFDVSHMGEFQVSGLDAAHFLDRLLVNAVSTIAIGKAVYSPMCAENGGVVDDLIVYRTAKDLFLVCVNASNIEKDFNWFAKQAKRWALDVQIENHSENYVLLAVQGPKAEAILQSAGFGAVNELKKFEHVESAFPGGKIRICRTGYTGEDGFEIYIAPEAAEDFIRLLMEKGSPFGMQLCGLGCRDSLRLEAGYPLYGHELSDQITPLEAGIGWTVKFQKEDFMGKEALTRQKENGIQRHVVHFMLEGRRIAREGTEVINADGEPVGKVLSGTLSPMLGSPIGSALVSAGARADELFVDLRGNRSALKIAKPPLYNPG